MANHQLTGNLCAEQRRFRIVRLDTWQDLLPVQQDEYYRKRITRCRSDHVVPFVARTL